MAEATSVVLLDILARGTKTKYALFSAAPQATSDTITFDTSTIGIALGNQFSKVLTAWAFDGSTGMSKNISSDGSTVLTTVGWTVGDNKWFIHVILKNEAGEGL